MTWPDALVILTLIVAPLAFMGFIEWLERRR